MSDTLYNTRQYVRFTTAEILQMLVTTVFVAFILSMRDLLFIHFGEAAGIQTLLFMLLFTFVALFTVVWVCKIVAIRLGYLIEYQAHYLGLMIGVVLSFASQGFLPLFLPGAFSYDHPERLRIGKWRSFYKGWELGIIAGSFALAMIAWVLILSPIYIFTRAELFSTAMICVILFALYACIPAPGVILQHTGRARDWFRYLRGTTFGLDIAYANRYWWMALCFSVLIFAGMTYLLTQVDERVGLIVYLFSLALGAFVLWIYHLFFKNN